MDILTQELLAPSFEESGKEEKIGVSASVFPLWWLPETKRNMTGLDDILTHLDNKMSAVRQMRTGFVGETTPMEKQIIERLSQLEQGYYELGDCVRAKIHIDLNEYEGRIWQRAKRAMLQGWSKTKVMAKKIGRNPVFLALSGMSTIAFGITVVKWLSTFLAK